MTQQRVALITGATGGIGRALALRLAKDGYDLMIVGRSAKRGEAVVHAIQQYGVEAHFVQADLSLMGEVRRVAELFWQRYGHLDLLVHSAGVIHTKRILTDEGLETTFATDYLSRFYLTNLLLDCLKASPAARILNIAASGGGMGTIHFDDLLGERKIGGMRGLGQAQFANDVHTIELARRLKDTAITVNAMHPGAVDTGIRRELPRWLNGIMGVLFSRVAMTADEGAEAPYYLATSPEVAQVSGSLFKKDERITKSTNASDPALGERLWQVSMQFVQEAVGVRA
ncbi:MAG: SDR family oxidoreductase [Anaerolineae bacterium]